MVLARGSSLARENERDALRFKNSTAKHMCNGFFALFWAPFDCSFGDVLDVLV